MTNFTFFNDFRDSLGHNLQRIGQIVREETNKVVKNYDLTPEQWQILVVLSRSNGLTPTELGEITLRDKTTISRILPPLFNRGVIRKENNPQDARSYVILVEEGCKQQVLASLKEIKEHFESKVFNGLRDDEQEQLLMLLLKLRRSLGDI